MILLNQIDESRRNEIIGLIKDKSLGFKIYPCTESHDLYYQTFRDLKKICKSKFHRKKKILFLLNKNNNFFI